jgi:hypothetical protein
VLAKVCPMSAKLIVLLAAFLNFVHELFGAAPPPGYDEMFECE